MKNLYALFSIVFFMGCQSSNDTSGDMSLDEASKWVNRTITAHGGEAYLDAHLAFDFRDRSYTLLEKDGQFVYTSSFEKNGDRFRDTLSNEQFTRSINGERQLLADTNVTKYSNSLNSVIYFAMLPKKLEDPATIKYDRGQVNIDGESYFAVEIRFREEGGGTDFDDTFYYWINTKTNYVDYLAYDYQVDGGGVRFRKAYNPQVVDGIRFQDYINYKADVGTPLADLPVLFEQGKLKELSRIELKNMKAI